MNSSPFLSPGKRSSWIDRVQALTEVILLAGILSSVIAYSPFALSGVTQAELTQTAPGIAAFVLLEAIITLGLMSLILKAHGEPFSSLGWEKKQWHSDVKLGVAVVPAFFLINIIIAYTFKVLLPKYFMSHNPLLDTMQSPRDLALLIAASLVAGGLKEELQRAFIINRFRAHLGSARIGLVLWSLAFGAGHYLQGLQGIVAATIFGLVFGVLYLTRGSVVAPVVAHGLYDTTALLLFWWFRAI